MVIRLLDKNTSEKIAAGEVIENPTSVVKELFENAIDAGAKRINIKLEGGGKKSITLIDDGSGIAEEEVELAFQRFATSKLSAFEDLGQLNTLGFRGEALPSIAAVSKVSLITRRKEDLAGFKIELSAGEVVSKINVGAPSGTSVEVSELFYNTPGRLKFLRAETAETARISALLSELALANPAVAITLANEKRILFNSTGNGDLINAIATLYGNTAADSMRLLDLEDPLSGCRISGYISAPHLTRSSRRWITVIVNGRLIKDALITNALERGFGDYLPHKRHPLAVLQLHIPTDMIDVNVHPAKVEIRLQDPEAVKNLVYRSVKKALRKSIQVLNSLDIPAAVLEKAESTAEEKAKYPDYSHDPLRLSFSYPPGQETDHTSKYEPQAEVAERIPDHELHLIGQFMKSYLVVQQEGSLLLIDQHAAHERVIYNQLLLDSNQSQEQPLVQLTVPYNIDFPQTWQEKIESLQPVLQITGFILDPIGDGSYVVRAVPQIMGEGGFKNEIYDLIETLITENYESNDQCRDRIYKMIACRRSIKANKSLSEAEMKRLLAEWQRTSRAYYCPHGRPTVIALSKDDLEKSFKRRGQ